MKIPSNAVPVLAEDIIREILLRLPVKILSKFKYVCKDWYTLIESQSFVNEHFVNKSNREHLLFFEHENDRLIMYDDESSSEYLIIPRRIYNVMGPVNGIFCVKSASGALSLLNPAMKQFKPLPLLSSNPCYYYGFLGFGFDSLRGCYKVVSAQVQAKPSVRIYNSGTHSWRFIEKLDMLNSLECPIRSKFNTYLNGVSYWIMQYRDHGFGVLSFNMTSDEFRIIQLPDDIRGGVHNLVLVVYGDSIAILSYIPSSHANDTTLIDIWVLENDERWTKISTLGPFKILRNTPFDFWKNNELILEGSTKKKGNVLTLYNILTHELRHVKARREMYCNLGYSLRSVYTYKQSLFSIKKIGEQL